MSQKRVKARKKMIAVAVAQKQFPDQRGIRRRLLKEMRRRGINK